MCEMYNLFINKITNKNRKNIMVYCSKPFEEFEIDVDGNCYCCCRWWNNAYCLGNIFEQSIDEIWNGNAAQELRNSILDGSYKYCNTKICLKSYNENINHTPILDFPTEISLCYDYTCTARCVFCNDEIKKMSKDECEKWKYIEETKLIPLFQNAKFIRLNMTGELFVSEHSKNFVKNIVKRYPDIKFEIVSNGIYATKENIQDLGIEDKIESIKFSLPSMNKRTYNKLVRNGNLNSVLANLDYISDLKRSKRIHDFRLNFVICSTNYKEIPSYIYRAESLGAIVDFIMLSKNDSSTAFLKNYEKYNVLSSNHPDYNSFISIINSNKIKNSNNANINKELYKLKKVSLKKRLLNTIKFYILNI